MKRQAVIEPDIGHLKQGRRIDRNRLKGEEGDRINAILSVAGMNFRKRAKWLVGFIFYLADNFQYPDYRLQSYYLGRQSEDEFFRID